MSFVDEQYATLLRSLDRQFMDQLGSTDRNPTAGNDRSTSPTPPALRLFDSSSARLTQLVTGPLGATADVHSPNLPRKLELAQKLQDWVRTKINLSDGLSLDEPKGGDLQAASAPTGSVTGGRLASVSIAQLFMESASALSNAATRTKLPQYTELLCDLRDLTEWHGEWSYLNRSSSEQPPIAFADSDTIALDRESHDLPTSSVDADGELELYQWWLAGRIAVGFYATIMRQLLDATLPLMQEIDFWEAQDGGARQIGGYLLATGPARLYNWAHTLLQFHGRPLFAPWLISPSVQNASASDSSINNIASGSIHWSTSLFPDLFHRHISGDVAKSSHLTTHPFPLTPSLLLHLARQEIRQKRNQLLAIQSYLSVSMGQFMSSANSRLGPTLQPSTTAAEGFSIKQRLVNHTLAMRNTLDYLNANVGSRSALQSIPTLNGLDVSAETERPTPIISIMLDSLRALQSALDTYQLRTRAEVAHLYSPSWLTRYWLPVATTGLAVHLTGRWLYGHRGDLTRIAHEIRLTARDYLQHWVLKPLQNVWHTIRHQDQTLALASAESLHSDLESLERMVVTFAHQHQGMDVSSEQARHLVDQVREGDLSLVLRSYESALQAPIRGALFGDLIQTLLIQVQKSKVDLQLAMTSLDKLLKSNELNFAFLAVAPALVVMSAVGFQIRRLWSSWRGGTGRRTGVEIRGTLRTIERLLNLHDGECSTSTLGAELESESKLCAGLTLPYEIQGFLLCLTHRLRHLAQVLPNGGSATPFGIPMVGWIWDSARPELPNLRRRFLEDVRDLEDPRLDCRQRIRTIERMYRTYLFI